MDFRWTAAPPARHYRYVALLLALLACWFAGTPSWAAATVERVDVRHDRITVRFDRSIGEASSFVLATPQRIALESRSVAVRLQAVARGGRLPPAAGSTGTLLAEHVAP